MYCVYCVELYAQVCTNITSVHIALMVDSVYEDHLRDYDTTGIPNSQCWKHFDCSHVHMYVDYTLSNSSGGLYTDVVFIVKWYLYRCGLYSKVVLVQRWSL